jgi:hypothetical protein
MTAMFHFRCLTPCFPRSDAVMVLFAGPTAYERNALLDAVTKESRRALGPEAAYLLYPADLATTAATDLVDAPEVFAALPDDAPIGIYGYDRDGQISLTAALRGSPPATFPEDAVRRQGLTTLFRRYGGVLDAGPTAHFVRPSTRSSTRFLRASHALSDGAEIYFAALWLLPHFAAEVAYVHLDTSAIASVALAALSLKRLNPQPVILTFHSYAGMRGHPFSIDRPDLVLISASQSGTMARELTELVADPARILTLFSSADAVTGTAVICDIRHDDYHNPMGYPPAREVGDTSRTRPIRLISEHFSVEPEPPRAVVPTVLHKPKVLDTLASLAGHGVFRSLRTTDIGDERTAVWIDMAALAPQPVFRDWVETMATRRVPAATCAIVQTGDDPQSAVLANAIAEAVARHGCPFKPQRLLLSDLEAGERNWAEPNSPVVVTGAVTGRGTQLLAASRALRRFAPHSHRIFLAPGAIGLSTTSIDLLRRNLRQPTHEFETMFELVLDRERSAESWRDERMLLEDLQRGKEPPEVEERIVLLNGKAEGRKNGLFLDAPAGVLCLRDNFAFWRKGTPCTSASHADVFTTICAVMEHMRSDATPIEQRLVNDAQTHTVLSVETFSRYNDGIIQASFLRAAHPIEMNYRDTPAESRLMLDLLRQMIRYGNRQQGEALAEFLLAIACGRLRLVEADLNCLRLELKAGVPGTSAVAAWLADCMVNRYEMLPIA